MDSSSNLIVLPSGREISIDLRNKKCCKINFLTGDFPGSPKSSVLHLNILGYSDIEAQKANDHAKFQQSGETLTLINFPFRKTGLITINKKLTIDFPMELKVTYEKGNGNGFPKEIEMAYSLE
jgi:hypothetical protein